MRRKSHLLLLNAMILPLLCLGFILIPSAQAHEFNHYHRLAQRVLKKHVVMGGASSTVKYELLQKNPGNLNEYLNELRMVSLVDFKKYNRDQQLAFLINAYNLYTLKLIVEHYPLKSIKDIGSLFSSTWSKEFDWLKLFGKKVSLDDIEHRMIREKDGTKEGKLVPYVYNEPRIHFAVNCASIGCPALLDEAYTAPNLDAMLTKAEKMFLSDKSRNRYDAKEKTLYLSPIFKWYGSDFERAAGSVKKYVAPKITSDPALQQEILSDAVDIEWTDYDWSLNEHK